MDTYEEAQKDGLKLLERLPGKGWRLELWENCGWTYQARLGPLQVCPGSDGGFFCLLSDEPKGNGGLSMWCVAGHKKPSVAVEKQMRKAREVVDSLNKLVCGVEKALRSE